MLVDRNARGVRLTDAGAALVRHAEAILARLAEAEAELEAIAGLRGGRAAARRVPDAPARRSSPPAIARFRERHPGVELTLDRRSPTRAATCCKRRRVRHRADHRRSARSTTRARRASTASTCSTTRCTSACRAAHPRRAPSRGVRLKDLATSRGSSGTTGTCPDRVFLRACQRPASSRRIAFHSDDYLAIQGFVAAGVGHGADPGAGAHHRARRRRDPLAARPGRRTVGSSPRRWPAATARRRPRRCSRSSPRWAASSRPAGARWRSSRDDAGPADGKSVAFGGRGVECCAVDGRLAQRGGRETCLRRVHPA